MKTLHDFNLSKGAENLTTLASVSLLLLIAGVAALLAIAGRNESARLRENLELTVVMADSVSDKQSAELAATLSTKPYVAQVTSVSRDEALRKWNEATGDDLISVYGVNPLSPEITLRLRSEYASAAQMQTLARGLETLPGVEGVSLPQMEFVEGMNRTLSRIIWCLAAVCAGLVAISLVLINNMVHLGIYSRRFAIRTMQLVGATDAFVRRPFLVRHAMIGLVAGLIATALLLLIMAAVEPLVGIRVYALLGWGDIIPVCMALIAGGVAICSIAAWYSTGRHLHARTNHLFA